MGTRENDTPDDMEELGDHVAPNSNSMAWRDTRTEVTPRTSTTLRTATTSLYPNMRKALGPRT
jgi:hypothetical protein